MLKRTQEAVRRVRIYMRVMRIQRAVSRCFGLRFKSAEKLKAVPQI